MHSYKIYSASLQLTLVDVCPGLASCGQLKFGYGQPSSPAVAPLSKTDEQQRKASLLNCYSSMLL